MQCPTCGREVESLVDGSCAQCASERLALLALPEVVDATLCAHCGRLHSGASWRPLPKDKTLRVEQVLREHLTLDPRVRAPQWTYEDRWEDERNVAVHVTVAGTLERLAVERAADTRIRFKNGACPDCSREMGGYFEAILQVRGSQGTDLARLLPRVEDNLVRRLDAFKEEARPNSFLGKVERTRHGIDFYFGSKEAAKVITGELAEHFGAETEESTKLVGRKDGRDLLRTTHLLRLPPYARGDFIMVDGKLCKLLSFDRRILHFLDLTRQVTLRRDVNRVDVKVVGRAHEQVEAVVVSRAGDHVQVLDPVSYRTVDLPKDGIPADAETVSVFRYEETLYLIPA